MIIAPDIKHKTDHALAAIRLGEQWLLLDNRMLVMVNATVLIILFSSWTIGACANLPLQPFRAEQALRYC